MTREPICRTFQFLTPAFPHGAYQSQHNNQPELRAPSLRGQLRWWWRALSINQPDPLGDDVFGSAAGDSGKAGKIQFRLHSPLISATVKSEILPHKTNHGHRGPKTALAPQREEFTLDLRPLREGISASQHERLTSVFDAWLLMGSVGQRSNRGAGSPWPLEQGPNTAQSYLKVCRKLLHGTRLRVALLDFSSDDPNELRVLAGRFPNSKDHRISGNVFGSASPRKPSPLKLRAVRLHDALHLAALWVPSNPIEDTPANLRAGIQTMLGIEQKRKLAILLESALPSLVA